MNPGTLEADAGSPSLLLLDDPSCWPSFGRALAMGGKDDRSTPARWESHVVFQGMRCAGCALAVERALRAVHGVLEVRVGAASQRGLVVWSPALTKPSDWLRAVRRAGYGVVPAQDRLARVEQQRDTRAALWRWLVAGFCMMQVMMYATPAYLADPGELGSDSSQLLRWASWVLTLPVMCFSASPFFSHAWNDLLRRRISMDLPVALGILITFAVSTLGTFDPQGPFGREVYFDSLTMFVFFLLSGRWLEMRLRERTLGALDALANRMPDTVLRRRSDGGFERVAADRLNLGDQVRVSAGEAFAADGVLTEGSTSVDEALLTGEARPVNRARGERVIAGSHNLGASVLMRVDRLGQQTRFAEIVALMSAAATSRPRAAALADRIATPFLLLVLLAAVLAAWYWWPTGPAHALAVAAAVLVVTCPCALSLATPTALLAGAGALARRGVLVRRLGALEALAGVDTVVFDKTGTLTDGTMTLARTRVRAGLSSAEALAMAAALASFSLHPLSKALVAAHAAQAVEPSVAANHERPGKCAAASDTWQAADVVELAGQGVRGSLTRGDAPRVPCQYRLGSASFCGVVSSPSPGPVVFLSDPQGWLASFELAERLRPDARVTLQRLRRAGLAVRMLSGDRLAAVRRVAAECGIEQAEGGRTPQEKLQCLAAWQQQGHRVAMVGDGLNDAPVLARADVSFALALAAPLSRAQADFVVLGERLGDVADTLLLARASMRVVRQNLGWAAGYNALCVPMALLGWLPAWLAGLGMALSSLLVLVNASRLASVRRFAKEA